MTKNKFFSLFVFLSFVFVLITPEIGFCTVEGTIDNIQGVLLGRILPALSILGLLFAGFSFLTGSQNAKNHLWLAIMGAIIGFGAPSIMAFIRGVVQ